MSGNGGTFTFILHQVTIPTDGDESRLAERVAAKLCCPVTDILKCVALRRSLDARKRNRKPLAVYQVRVEMPDRRRVWVASLGHPNVVLDPGATDAGAAIDPSPTGGLDRPVVVGAGPAGLFAALRLARAGWRPIVIERGDPVAERRRVVASFWRHGALDPESNVLFGEGGAGLFSDGKLNTRHKDRQGLGEILRLLVGAGAPESILIDAEPHIGSDLLSEVVENLADAIRRAGGEIRYRTRLDGIEASDGAMTGLRLSGPEGQIIVSARGCVLATGHSARDIFAMLHASGVGLEARPFALGLRAEMPQEGIDRSQRPDRNAPGAAASFRLTFPGRDGLAGSYSFCMCPGGLVIACASESGRLAVNGMSRHDRSGDRGNAAFLVPVIPGDIREREPISANTPAALAGIAFQRKWEREAFQLGGGEYAVPCSSLENFLTGSSGTLPARRGVERAAAADLRLLLPAYITETLVEALPAMLSRLRHVDPTDVVLYGVESRSSSPVRIVRNDDGSSVALRGLYPAGEGSGYAGGIMTSALDGWRAAGKLMEGA